MAAFPRQVHAHRCAEPPRQFHSTTKGPIHADATDCPQLFAGPRDDDRDCCSKPGLVGRISRNLGTADGLYARCDAAMWRPDSGCEPDRGLLAAEHAVAWQFLPRGIRI